MADDVSKVQWLDEVKRTKKLTIFLDDSIGKNGWTKAFTDAIPIINGFSLGVTFDPPKHQKPASIEAYAKKGNFEFEFKDPTGQFQDIPKKTKKFDGNSVHGLCVPVIGDVRDRTSRLVEKRLAKAFIYVPEKPYIGEGKNRLVGDPVKLVVAVHELVHACGLVDDNQHTVDDVFSWPKLKIGNRPDDDRVEVFTGRREDVTIAGRTIKKSVMAEMPPIFLNGPTANKIRALWA